MSTWVRALRRRALQTLRRHPTLRLLYRNVKRDKPGMLAPFISWSILTSIIPLTVGVVAIFSLFVQDPAAQANLERLLSRLLQGAISTQDIDAAVRSITQHTGVLRVLGVLGVLWGASNIGGSFAGAFQVIFATRARPVLQEKLIDIGMIFVFTGLMAIILFASTATAFLDKLASSLPFPAPTEVALATGISLLSAFVLFAAIYTVFPNIETGYKLRHVWLGALLAAVLFQIVSTIWPLYVHLSHATRYGAVLFSLIVLTAWIYAFSYILIAGAEVIAAESDEDLQVMHQHAAAVARARNTRDQRRRHAG